VKNKNSFFYQLFIPFDVYIKTCVLYNCATMATAATAATLSKSKIIQISLALIVVLVILVFYNVYYAKTTQEIKDIIQISLPRPYGVLVPLSDPLRARTMAEYRTDIQQMLNSAIAAGEFGKPSDKLGQACNLALSGGARIRSIIAFEVSRMLQLKSMVNPKNTNKAINISEIALLNEYLHTASLIIDDMPEFDNDLVRRGKPSVIAFAGRAVAQMAAISMVAAAFSSCCRHTDHLVENHAEIIDPYKTGALNASLITTAIGAQGAARGQLMDISETGELPKDKVEEMISLKTAVFFQLATSSGWVASGGSIEDLDTIREAGRHLGIAYQIADDISDMAKDAARAASVNRSDPNFANAHGIKYAYEELNYNLAETKYALTSLGLWSALWEKEIFPLMIARASETVN